jgi:hypothetical protein
MVCGTRVLSLVACATWLAAILSAAAEECCSAEPEPVQDTMFVCILLERVQLWACVVCLCPCCLGSILVAPVCARILLVTFVICRDRQLQRQQQQQQGKQDLFMPPTVHSTMPGQHTSQRASEDTGPRSLAQQSDT